MTLTSLITLIKWKTGAHYRKKAFRLVVARVSKLKTLDLDQAGVGN